MIDVDLIARAVLTPGGHLHIGRGGLILHYDSTRLSYGNPDCNDLKQAALMAGLPIIDSRPVPFEIAIRLAIHGPMIAVDRSPWDDLIAVPLATLSTVYRQVGADVHNIADDPDTAGWFLNRRSTSLELLVDDWLRHILRDAMALSVEAEETPSSVDGRRMPGQRRDEDAHVWE